MPKAEIQGPKVCYTDIYDDEGFNYAVRLLSDLIDEAEESKGA